MRSCRATDFLWALCQELGIADQLRFAETGRRSSSAGHAHDELGARVPDLQAAVAASDGCASAMTIVRAQLYRDWRKLETATSRLAPQAGRPPAVRKLWGQDAGGQVRRRARAHAGDVDVVAAGPDEDDRVPAPIRSEKAGHMSAATRRCCKAMADRIEPAGGTDSSQAPIERRSCRRIGASSACSWQADSGGRPGRLDDAGRRCCARLMPDAAGAIAPG